MISMATTAAAKRLCHTDGFLDLSKWKKLVITRPNFLLSCTNFSRGREGEREGGRERGKEERGKRMLDGEVVKAN